MEERILTIPNALSFVRLLLVPVFLWLVLGPKWDELALAVLMTLKSYVRVEDRDTPGFALGRCFGKVSPLP